MSGDLISRKALMERILQEEYDNDIYKDAREREMYHGEYQRFYKVASEISESFSFENLIKNIKNMIRPTAQYRHRFCGTVADDHCVKYENCEDCITEQIIGILKFAANATNGKNGV